MNKEKAARMRDETLKQLYTGVLRSVLLREHSQRSLPSFSQHREAAASALAQILRPGDSVAVEPGERMLRMLRGVPLSTLLAPSHSSNGSGPDTDLSRKGRRARVPSLKHSDPEEANIAHGFLPGVAEQAGLAAGIALAASAVRAQSFARLRHPENRMGNITVLIASHDGSANARPLGQGWRDAALLAARRDLPMLFLADTPPPPEVNTDPGKPHWMPVIPVDRDDVIALYRVCYESAMRARHGGGPTWIECLPFLLSTASASRPMEDALTRAEQSLRARALFSEEWKRTLVRTFEKELTAAGAPRA